MKSTWESPALECLSAANDSEKNTNPTAESLLDPTVAPVAWGQATS